MSSLKNRLLSLGKKMDFSEGELQKFDLTRKYDEDFSDADGITWRDHLLLYVIVLLTVIFILWASFAKLDEVARGDGKVIPFSEVQVIQNLEGGIIDALPVREGDVVMPEEVLVRLRNIEAKSDLDANSKKFFGLAATVARLQAEAEGVDPVFSEEMTLNAPESVAAERAAFTANSKRIENETSVLKEQLTQQRQKIGELETRIKDTTSVLELTKKERSMLAPLVARGSASQQELLQLDRSIAQQKTELNGYQSSLPRQRAVIKEAEAQLEGHLSSFKADAQRQLSERTTEMNALKEMLAALKDKSARTEVRSPVHGIVKSLKFKTIGGVVRPGEAIMDIVPLEDQLLVEAQIRPADIAFIVPGQRAVVRISAYDFSIYGALEGEVTDISADSITNDKGESFYRVRARTDQTKLVKDGKEHNIIPGMQATVDIITGKRTVMQYIMKPLIKASQTAMTER